MLFDQEIREAIVHFSGVAEDSSFAERKDFFGHIGVSGVGLPLH
jgi:hypothetical protein